MSSLLPLLALVALAPASTGGDGPSYTARSTIVTALDPSMPIYSTPRGVGYDGVAGLLIQRPSGTFLCTGSLVGGGNRHVVTAAHCVQGATSVDAVFFPPGGGTIVRTSSTFTIRSGYTGNVVDENDIAVLDLGSGGQVSGIDSYDLFTGNALGETYNVAGFGRSGTGNTGSILASGTRRQGFNRFDFSGIDPIFGGSGLGFEGMDILFADFDNGLAAQDASCRLTAFFTAMNSGYCDLGLGALEAMTAPGDSGGPLLVDGRLAAVSSFGLTFGNSVVGDIDGNLNSTFGEFGGYVPISAHAEWIQQQIVPEPGTILLLLTGLLAVAAVHRRRSSHEA